jgi:serine/threonine-protein kinase
MSPNFSPGACLGHYEIKSQLGAGGMGEVYLAEDSRLHRKVALKILPAEMAAKEDRMRRFKQEATAAAALNHPNIAHIYEIGESDGTNFIAMEFVEGVTLREKIHRDKTELRKLLRYLQHVAEGLAKAHAAGIVHRDLKPDNIMITREGHAKILDFGLAKLIEPRLSDAGTEDAATAIMRQQSTPGVIMGTVGYMSPEQAQGKTTEIDQRSDIFSFGCILFEGATGRKPFEGESVIKSLHMVVYESAPPITELNPSAPAELQRIVRRCLAKDPDERYQSIKEVAIELKELRREIEGAGIDTTVPPPASGRTAGGVPGADPTRSESGGPAIGSTSSSLQTPASSAEYILTGIKRHKLAAVVVVLVLVAASIGLGLFWRARNGTAGGAINSIAVLPFENRSGNPDSEYLSDGIAESLIYRLSQLPNLKVSPANSVFRYKGKNADIKTIANELGVSAVMVGRMSQRGDDLNISVELIDAANNKLIWGEQYDRKSGDLLVTQREIAAAIVQKLQLTFSGNEAKGLTKTYTDSNEAYQHYLKGRFYWNKRYDENLRKAIEQFQAAAEKDPNFALAYVGLADCHVLLPFYSKTLSPDAIPKAKAYAQRALEIDPSLGEAHASLAYSYYMSWEWNAAEPEFKEAIALSPNYATGHKWYGNYLEDMHRQGDSLNQLRRAQELEPLSLIISENLADRYLQMGDLESAYKECIKVTELDPGYAGIYRTLSLVELKRGNKVEASSAASKAVELSKRNGAFLAILGYVQSQIGNKEEASKLVKELEEKSSRHEATGLQLAMIFAGLGDKDAAFTWLEKDFQSRNSVLVAWMDYVTLESLQTDPRMLDLRRRMGLPQ